MLRSLLLAAAFVGTPAAATPPPASHQYTVVAQGLVEFTGGTYAWRHSPYEFGGVAVTVETEGPTFLVARGDGAVVVTGSDGSGALLADREAELSRDAAVTWTAIALAESGGETAATIRLDAIAIVPAEPEDGTFTIETGSHDVELRHVELAPGASLQEPGDGTAFVIVTAGAVVDDAGTTVEPGGTLHLAASAAMTNASEQPAVVLIAVIGPALDTAQDVDSTTAATAPPSPTTTSTTTTTAPPVDTDGDGLTDDRESELGTDPNDPDSDGDSIDDGAEVDTYGTDPLAADSDTDDLDDYAEIDTYGTVPTDADSDDDGLTDGFEAIPGPGWQGNTDPLDFDSDEDGLGDGAEENEHGTVPNAADTDSDTLSDGVEVNDYGTDPTADDTDGDTIGDADEINNWGSDPTDTDSDDDTLVDGEEVNGTHTSPTNADTDGDTIDDGTEAGNGTDPNDANDP